MIGVRHLCGTAVGRELDAAIICEPEENELCLEQRGKLAGVRPAVPLDQDKAGIFLPADRGNTWGVEVHDVPGLDHGSPKNKRGPVARAPFRLSSFGRPQQLAGGWWKYGNGLRSPMNV